MEVKTVVRISTREELGCSESGFIELKQANGGLALRFRYSATNVDRSFVFSRQELVDALKVLEDRNE